MTLNDRALRLADDMAANSADLRIAVQTTGNGARILDCGAKTVGGVRAGLGLARVCLADLADVCLVPGDQMFPQVQVTTDHPLLACMASQYAGWQVSVGKFFAMGSGPMRAAYGKEAIFDHIPGRETGSRGHRRVGNAEDPDGRGGRVPCREAEPCRRIA